MAVVLINEITGRDGSRDVDTNRRYRRTWLMRTSVPDDGVDVVLAASPVARNDPYEYVNTSGEVPTTVKDPLMVCIDVRASQDNANDPRDWRLTAEYVGIDDPLAQPAEVEYNPTRYQKSLVVDLDGKPVVNAANDPFETGITVDRTRFTLTISKPVLDWDPVAALEFQDSVNQETFVPTVGKPGFPAKTCKLTWGAKRVRRAGNTFYWLRTSVIDIDLEGWNVKLRNAGLNELVYDPAGEIVINKKRIWVGKPATEATSPQLLTPNGTYIGPLAPGSPLPAPLEFRGYNLKSWVTLDLQY